MRSSRRSTTKRTSRAATPTSPGGCVVVGVGTSAGGLEALEQFFRSLPTPCGVAFVVVQHLDPSRKGMLVELLRRTCPLGVVEIEHGMLVEAERVYVIPPNADLTLTDGVFGVAPPAEPRGQRLPIDSFFRSLAATLGDRSVGVLLSGMGSDGTAGLGAIRSAGGATFVEEPRAAKFGRMPASAIEAGVVDVVAPPQALAARIVEHVRAARARPRRAARSRPTPMEEIVEILRSTTGHDFGEYKPGTLERRIERRMALHRLDDLAAYAALLRQTPQEAELLFNELLIGVTTFFRDGEVWADLARVLRGRLAAAVPGSVIRAWVPACSTGEEAYSLAIVLREVIEECAAAKNLGVQIFASDVDTTAIARARQGLFPTSIAADVSPARLARFFVEEDGGYRARSELRESIVFAVQNVLRDPPFTHLDVISCRNLFIYLTPAIQESLVPLFHYCLRPHGILVLGSAESVGGFSGLFAGSKGRSRLYHRLEPAPAALRQLDFPSGFGRLPTRVLAAAPAPRDSKSASVLDLRGLVEQVLVERFAPTSVLVGAKGDVLYVHGQIESYLELPAGKANWNVLAMAREGLRQPLANALRRATKSGRPVTVDGIRLGGRRRARDVTMTAVPLDEPPGLRGTVVLAFTESRVPKPEDGAPVGARRRRTTPDRLEAELARAREELGRTRRAMRLSEAELQSANEELQSTNEELQSTNEELQSTNEELTTSKEEMQSMNEELQTLNAELLAKVDDDSRTSSDLKNLLDSTEIAVLFLDPALRIRRFTPQAASLFKLIPGDVGRPLADLTSELDYAALEDDARAVIRTLVSRETIVLGRGRRRFGVRIMPYRTRDGRVDGVVITCTRALEPSTTTSPGART